MPLYAPASPTPADPLDASIARAQRPDGHWVFELEADATIPAGYILLRHYLGEPVDAALEASRALSPAHPVGGA